MEDGDEGNVAENLKLVRQAISVFERSSVESGGNATDNYGTYDAKSVDQVIDKIEQSMMFEKEDATIIENIHTREGLI